MSLSYQQLTVRGVDNELEVCEPTPSSKLSQDSGICLKDTSENRKKEKYISYPAQNLKLQNSMRQNIIPDVLFNFGGLRTKSDFKRFKLFPSATRTPFLLSKGTIWYTSQPSHRLLKGTAASTSNNLLK